MALPEGFSLACVMKREDPRDALVSNKYNQLCNLPKGATVGTSSLRRMSLLKSLRPDLNIEPLRGNLDTRLSKLDSGDFDAIVLAAAGLKRLGLADRIQYYFEPDQMLPAAGQGALGIEVCSVREDVARAVSDLADQDTWLCVSAERSVSRIMGGSCSMPLAAYATLTDQTLCLDAAWGDSSGRLPVVKVRLQKCVNNLEDASRLGESVAAALIEGVLKQGGNLSQSSEL